jgi:hypothetical protein
MTAKRLRDTYVPDSNQPNVVPKEVFWRQAEERKRIAAKNAVRFKQNMNVIINNYVAYRCGKPDFSATEGKRANLRELAASFGPATRWKHSRPSAAKSPG